MQHVIVIGAGGFGREALDVLEAINRSQPGPRFSILGVVDDQPSPTAISRLRDRGYEHLGGLDQWAAEDSEALYVLAVGNPRVRSEICSRIRSSSMNLSPLTAVHPSAVVGSAVRIGAGSVVCAGVQISTNVRLGEYVHLNPGTIIGHDAELADFVSINPGAVISGDVAVGRAVLVGAGAVVLQGLSIGADATVGAGGVVTRDVEGSIVVKGVPAR